MNADRTDLTTTWTGEGQAAMAEKIPQFPATASQAPSVWTMARQTQGFLHWLGIMFLFGVAVLAIDYWKSERLYGAATALDAYRPWVLMNAIAGLVILGLSAFPILLRWNVMVVCGAVLAVALVRSTADYVFGRRFLFP